MCPVEQNLHSQSSNNHRYNSIITDITPTKLEVQRYTAQVPAAPMQTTQYAPQIPNQGSVVTSENCVQTVGEH